MKSVPLSGLLMTLYKGDRNDAHFVVLCSTVLPSEVYHLQVQLRRKQEPANKRLVELLHSAEIHSYLVPVLLGEYAAQITLNIVHVLGVLR